MLQERPVFICGMYRSGTTLLQSLLDGHPELVVHASESAFFQRFLPEVQKGKLNRQQKTLLAEQILLSSFYHQDNYYDLYLSHISNDTLKQNLVQQVGLLERDADYLTASVLAFGEVSGQVSDQSRYWVEKTPNNEQYAKQIFLLWPKAKCIHIVRDPRDVFTTLQRRAKKKGRATSLAAFAHRWQETVRLLQQHMKTWPEQYLYVRYEQLATDPEREISRIRQFLGISDHGALYNPTKAGGKHLWKGNSSRNIRFSGIDARSVGQWKGRLSPNTLAILEELLRKEMLACSYELETRSSAMSRIRALPSKVELLAHSIRSKLWQ